MSTLQPTFVVVMTCVVIVSAAFGAPPAGSEQPIPKTRAVLELAVPAGTTISVNGQSFGAQRRFEFQPLTPRKHYTYNVEVQGPGVPRTVRRILLEGGWRVRWTPQVPDESRPELVVQAGHTDGIRYVVLSPDGERFLTAGSDQRAILWDLAQGRVIREFHAPPGGALTGQSGLDEPRFSADGKFIFTSARHALPNFASGGELAVWDAETGRKRTVMNVANHLGGGVISADFRVVAAQTQSASGLLLRVWSAETGRPIRDITEQVAYFSAWELRLSADGKLLAAILDSGKRVWSTETGRLLGGDEAWLAATGERLPDKSSLGGRVTPDGKHVARKEGYRSWWNLFEVATGNEVHGDFMNDRSNDVVDFNEMTDVAFTRDGRQAICTGGYSTVGTYGVGKNGKIGICDTLTGAPLRMIQTALPARIKTVNFAPTQSWLMTGLVGTSRLSPSPETSQQKTDLASNTGVIVWDLTKGQPIQKFRQPNRFIMSAGFSADSQSIITTGAGEGDPQQAVFVSDMGTGRSVLFQPRESTFADTVGRGALSRDGRHILTFCNGLGAVLDRETGRTISTAAMRSLTDGDFSPSGQHFVAVGRSPNMTDVPGGLVYAPTGAVAVPLKGAVLPLAPARYSPTGKQVVTGTPEGEGAIWDPRTGKLLHRLTGHAYYHHWAMAPLTTVAWDAFGASVATGGLDGRVLIWDAATGTRIREFQRAAGLVTQVAFSRDGRFIVAGSDDGDTVIWDIATGEEVARLFQFLAEDGQLDWLIATPQGYFDGTPAAREKVSYRVGGPYTIVPVDRFFQDFYRPGLLAEIFGGSAPTPEVKIAENQPPRIEILAPLAGETTDHEITLEVAVTDLGGGVSGPTLRHNGSRILGSAPARREGDRLLQRFGVKLVSGENRLRVEAASGDGSWESEPGRITLTYLDKAPSKPTLFVVAVGVNKYADESMNLTFATRDAQTLADLFEKRGGALYQDVNTTVLLDDNASKSQIHQTFTRIAGVAQPQDTLLVFFSGHGFTVGQRYYFLPHEFQQRSERFEDDVRRLGLAADELGDSLAAIPALKRMLILDTCNSGAALGRSGGRGKNPFAFRGAVERLSRAQGLFTIAASAASQETVEIPALKHGVLTYSLLAGLQAVQGSVLPTSRL